MTDLTVVKQRLKGYEVNLINSTLQDTINQLIIVNNGKWAEVDITPAPSLDDRLAEVSFDAYNKITFEKIDEEKERNIHTKIENHM